MLGWRKGRLENVLHVGSSVTLEAACRRAVACDAIAAKTVQCILHRGLDREPLPGEAAPVPPSPPAPAYARTFFDLFNPADPATTEGEKTWTSPTNSPRC